MLLLDICGNGDLPAVAEVEQYGSIGIHVVVLHEGHGAHAKDDEGHQVAEKPY